MLLKSRICNYSGNMLKYKQLRHEKCMKTQKNKTYGVDYVMLMKAKLKVSKKSLMCLKSIVIVN